jgi:YD repeat-containing protein
VLDPLNHLTTATYDEGDLTSQTQTVAGRDLTTTYTYNDYGQVLTATDPLGHVTRFTYDAYGKPQTSTDALGNTTSFQYDDHGNLLSTTSPTGVTTTYTYFANGNVESVTTPNGSTLYTYYAPGDSGGSPGDVKSVTDAHDVATTYTYDANGNPLTSQWTWHDPANPGVSQVLTTTNLYDAEDRLIRTITADGTITNTVYDAAGRVTWTDDPHLSGQAHVNGTHTVYDAAGRVISTEQYHDVVITVNNPNSTAPSSTLSSSGTAFSVSSTVYDAQGRVLWTDDPHQPGRATNGTFTEYDDNSQVTGTERYANVVITIGTDPVTGAPTSTLGTQPAPGP